MIQTIKNKLSKLIAEYKIYKYSSGIICIEFRTFNRWIKYFHRLNDTNYEFCDKYTRSEEIEIPDVIGEKDYICVKNQEKDYIYFYYVPYNLIQDGKLIKNLLK